MIRALGRSRPRVPPTAFVYPSAEVIGKVRLGVGTSVWPGAVLRGDIESIVVGAGSNIQDNVVIHTDRGVPTVVGRRVTVGHGAILHSCRVGDGAMIGMGALLLSGSVVGKGALVGAGSLVPPGARIPSGHLALGRPARTIRPLRADEKSALQKNAQRYEVSARRYKNSLK